MLQRVPARVPMVRVWSADGTLLPPTATDTYVRVRDLFQKRDIGVFQGRYTTPHAVEAHGVQMLRLSFEPHFKMGL
eukprot:COSAG01_NODE_3570_length_5924_cov_4.911588_10_plen_76_part_00